MNEAYEEIIQGEAILRPAPGARHERICLRLHALVAASLMQMSVARLLSARSVVELTTGTLLRPDLSLVTSATGKPWLLAEIINAEDHRVDTVVKKSLYEDMNVPRLWMVDARYDNVEIYHGTQHGLALICILAGREIVKEALLPGLQFKVVDLFAD